jgi:hypothetical protein
MSEFKTRWVVRGLILISVFAAIGVIGNIMEVYL